MARGLLLIDCVQAWRGGKIIQKRFSLSWRTKGKNRLTQHPKPSTSGSVVIFRALLGPALACPKRAQVSATAMTTMVNHFIFGEDMDLLFFSWKVYTRELSLKKEWAGSSLRFFLMDDTISPLFLYTTCGGSRMGGFHKCVTLAAPNRYNQEQNVPRDWREIRHIPFRASRINHPEGHSPLYRKMVHTIHLGIGHAATEKSVLSFLSKCLTILRLQKKQFRDWILHDSRGYFQPDDLRLSRLQWKLRWAKTIRQSINQLKKCWFFLVLLMPSLRGDRQLSEWNVFELLRIIYTRTPFMRITAKKSRIIPAKKQKERAV